MDILKPFKAFMLDTTFDRMSSRFAGDALIHKLMPNCCTGDTNDGAGIVALRGETYKGPESLQLIDSLRRNAIETGTEMATEESTLVAYTRSRSKTVTWEGSANVKLAFALVTPKVRDAPAASMAGATQANRGTENQ